MRALETDVAVIGAGSAGSSAFHEIRRAGRKALLIDRGPLGTTCARVGCMPSKAVLHAGRHWSQARSVVPALAGSHPEARDGLWRAAIATRDRLVAGAAERTRRAAGEHLLMGHARFVSPGTLDVDGVRVHARAFVLATGSSPFVPAAMRELGDRLLTTDTLFELDRLPRSLGVVGLGAIGLEIGLALSRLGVEVVGGDLKAAPGGMEDPIVATRARERFAREFDMWLGRELRVERAGASGATISDGQHSRTVDRVLVALGRRPNIHGLELASAGIEADPTGRLPADPKTLRVGASQVFVAGDVLPERPLMHEALDEGVIAARGAEALLSGAGAAPPARRTPLQIVFSDPDLVAVGAPFGRIEAAGAVIGTAEGSGNGRSRILGSEDNLVRVYADGRTGTLLGASLMAEHGEHLAHLLAWAVQRRETVAGLLEMPFYHPTIEEMLQSALKDAASQLARNAK